MENVTCATISEQFISEFENINTVLGDGISGKKEIGISTTAFDSQEDLLWIGTRGGHVRI